MLALVSLALFILVSPSLFSHGIRVKVGEFWASENLVSPFDFNVTDEADAERQRAESDRYHPKIFRHDLAVQHEAEETIKALMVRAAQPGGETSATELQHWAADRLGLRLDDQTIETIIANAQNGKFWGDLQVIVRHVFGVRGLAEDKQTFANAVRSGRAQIVRSPNTADSGTTAVPDVLAYPNEAMAYLNGAYLPSFGAPPDVVRAYSSIVGKLLRPNLFYDPKLTESQKQLAQQSIKPMLSITRGDTILKRGDTIDARQVLIVDRLNEKYRQYNLIKTIGTSVFVILFIIFMIVYSRKYAPQLTFSPAHVLMVALPVVVALFVGRAGLSVGARNIVVAYAFPAGMIGMLSVILFDARFAIVQVVMASLLFGVATGMQFPFFLVAIAGGLASVASLYSIRERKDVLLAGMRLALVNVVTIMATELAMNPGRLDLAAPIGGVVNGILCYALTVGSLPLFESLFHVTTDVRLMELTSTNHPLLDEMADKAPGSFQHAMNVSKLAERAADAIGANFLLVRAGAYFHDIGKMLKPKYYSENQVTAEERKIHSKLSPYMSTLIIKNHVKDGVELARKHHLPEQVVDFIPEHQGTGLIKYFYMQALQKADEDDTVVEEEFRYPGPKPQSIEAAIVMLADTVEAIATARFSGKTNIDEDDITKLVRDAVNEKFHDGQFDECRMTFADLHKISESLVQTLLSSYHHRVDYPTMAPKREPKDHKEPGETPPAAEGKPAASA